MEKLKPFGFHYEGNTCHIKLRFHPTKWNKGDVKVGTTRYTRNGYVLFEITVHTKSQEYDHLISELKKINAS